MNKGKLSIKVHESSYVLREKLPIEVRNSQLYLITTLTDSRTIELDSGLYEVNFIANDGKKHRHIINIRPGIEEKINFNDHVNTGIDRDLNFIKNNDDLKFNVMNEMRRNGIKTPSPSFTLPEEPNSSNLAMTKHLVVRSKVNSIKDVNNKTISIGENSEKANNKNLKKVDKTIEDIYKSISDEVYKEKCIVDRESGFIRINQSAVTGIYDSELNNIQSYKQQRKNASGAKLVTLYGAKVSQKSHGYWELSSSNITTSIPRAYINFNGQRQEVSLPVNPGIQDPSNTCTLQMINGSYGPSPRAWISQSRAVPYSLQKLLASGQILLAAEIASDAIELLRNKYHDPIGATLGALLLNKVGKLSVRTRWVENLCNDFDWLPDGKVLYALLLLQQEDVDHKKALELALKACDKRIMFTETYSLLINLLRRWPDNHDPQTRKNALNKLLSYTPYIDWEAITLTLRSV